jgi:hypothetical protein
MKHITLLALLICSIVSQAQEAKYQTYSADLTIIATKDGNDQQWENKNISVVLDYKTGNISIEIRNNDFYNKETQEVVKNKEELNNGKFTLKGILPIEQILNQKTYNHEYTTELQLINDNIDFSKQINFNMNVLRTSQQSKSYRVFTFIGKLYNDELNIPAFKGFDNEVEIRILFNVYWNG